MIINSMLRISMYKIKFPKRETELIIGSISEELILTS